MKDKARMQHRHSMPNIADDLANSGTPRSTKRGKLGECQPLLWADEAEKGKSKSRKGSRVQWDMEARGANQELSGLCNGIVHVSAIVDGMGAVLPWLLPGHYPTMGAVLPWLLPGHYPTNRAPDLYNDFPPLVCIAQTV